MDDFDNLVDGWNCTAPSINEFPADLFNQEQRRSGALTLHILADLYLFYALAIICDEYFVPSVERIAKELKIPSDIAGCTVMGIANSSPELFTNIIGTFVTKGDLGIGTIVGASVFNILAVAACIGLCTRKLVPVSWWAVSRDSFFYIIAIAVVYQALVDNYIKLLDTGFLLGLYFLYLIVIFFNTRLRNFSKRMLRRVQTPYSSSRSYTVQTKTSLPRNASVKTLTNVSLDMSVDDVEKIEDIDLEVEEENMKIFQLPGDGATRTTWLDFIIGWPIRVLLKVTIPDCKASAWKKWYFVTFFMCVVWNTALCFAVSWMTTIIGFTIGIPDTLLGLTVIAAGTSVPQAVGSIILARKGLGTMALNNAIGSNIFNVLICFSIPWMIRILIDKQNLEVHSQGLGYSVLMLLGSMILLYTLLACNKFYFDRRIGVISLLCYLLFLVVGSLFEMNVFFTVSLPMCPSSKYLLS